MKTMQFGNMGVSNSSQIDDGANKIEIKKNEYRKDIGGMHRSSHAARSNRLQMRTCNGKANERLGEE